MRKWRPILQPDQYVASAVVLPTYSLLLCKCHWSRQQFRFDLSCCRGRNTIFRSSLSIGLEKTEVDAFSLHERGLSESRTNDGIRISEGKRTQGHKGHDEDIVRVALLLNHFRLLLDVWKEALIESQRYSPDIGKVTMVFVGTWPPALSNKDNCWGQSLVNFVGFVDSVAR
jgi:hypothetical protein